MTVTLGLAVPLSDLRLQVFHLLVEFDQVPIQTAHQALERQGQIRAGVLHQSPKCRSLERHKRSFGSP